MHRLIASVAALLTALPAVAEDARPIHEVLAEFRDTPITARGLIGFDDNYLFKADDDHGGEMYRIVPALPLDVLQRIENCSIWPWEAERNCRVEIKGAIRVEGTDVEIAITEVVFE